MLITSHLTIQTTNIFYSFLTCTCAPQLRISFRHPWPGATPGQQRRSGSSHALKALESKLIHKSRLHGLNATVRGLRHWNYHLLSFWLSLSLCYVSYVTVNWRF